MPMNEMTYTRCPDCLGSGVIPPGRKCYCTLSSAPGWIPTGLTVAQIERMVDLERALAGDPGVPAERRKEILLDCRQRVGWDVLGHGDPLRRTSVTAAIHLAAKLARRDHAPPGLHSDPAMADLDRLYSDAASMIRSLADDLAEARRVCESLAARCAGQSELLERRAEG